MTTVACLYVRGEYPYTVEYVSRLRAMVARWMDRPFRFVCLTDKPNAMPGDVEAVPIAKLHGFAYWSKLELFNPARDWDGRVLYLDLDTLIVSSLAPILDTRGFAITDDRKGRTGPDAFGRQIVRRVNSSVMAWDGGTQTDLYTQWTPDVSDRLSGDQDWIGLSAPDAALMPREWFPRVSEIVLPIPASAKVVLCKHPKNHIAREALPWVGPLWGAA